MLILYTAAACVLSYIIPEISYSFVIYKCKKKDRSEPEKRKSKSWNLVCAAVGGVCAAISLYYMETLPACFCIIFSFFALFGTIVDSYIRIIANEMLLLMLPIGIIYRIAVGGPKSLLGALAALGLVIAVFGAAMAATKALKGASGVGMGDIKLAMVIAITVGWPGVLVFLGGMAVAIGGYCAIGIMSHMLFMDSYFPMAGMLMAGFMAALLEPGLQSLCMYLL